MVGDQDRGMDHPRNGAGGRFDVRVFRAKQYLWDKNDKKGTKIGIFCMPIHVDRKSES